MYVNLTTFGNNKRKLVSHNEMNVTPLVKSHIDKPHERC